MYLQIVHNFPSTTILISDLCACGKTKNRYFKTKILSLFSLKIEKVQTTSAAHKINEYVTKMDLGRGIFGSNAFSLQMSPIDYVFVHSISLLLTMFIFFWNDRFFSNKCHSLLKLIANRNVNVSRILKYTNRNYRRKLMYFVLINVTYIATSINIFPLFKAQNWFGRSSASLELD